MHGDLTEFLERLAQQIPAGLGPIVTIFIGLVLLVLVIVWVLLPFAILGTKGRIDRALSKLDAITVELSALNRQINELRATLPEAQHRLKFETTDESKPHQALSFDLEKKDDKPAT